MFFSRNNYVTTSNYMKLFTFPPIYRLNSIIFFLNINIFLFTLTSESDSKRLSLRYSKSYDVASLLTHMRTDTVCIVKEVFFKYGFIMFIILIKSGSYFRHRKKYCFILQQY